MTDEVRDEIHAATRLIMLEIGGFGLLAIVLAAAFALLA